MSVKTKRLKAGYVSLTQVEGQLRSIERSGTLQS